MTGLPIIKEGTKWGDTSSSEWQNLINTVSTMVGDVDQSKPLVGVIEGLRKFIPIRRFVVLVEKPESGKPLQVRKVEYADMLPVEGKYKWTSGVIDAYPEIGNFAADFNGFQFVPVRTADDPDPVPGIETLILVAEYRNSTWKVTLPLQTERPVVVREFFNNDPGSRFVMVQEVAPEIGDDGVWTGGYVTISDAVQVNVWMTMVAGDFAPFIWTADKIDRNVTSILPLSLYKGVWYLKQRPQMGVVRIRGPVKTVDCAPASAGGA